jgi:hypothetical protein
MKRFGLMFAFSIFAAIATTSTIASAAPKTCDATAVAAARAAIDAACPCAGKADATGTVVPWKSHGQYVSCVARARNGAARQARLRMQCMKSVVPCAAHSTCGTSDAVACVNTTGACLNDPVPGDTVKEGSCDNDSSVACDTDADCSEATCAVMSPAECTASGGSAAVGTCCSE